MPLSKLSPEARDAVIRYIESAVEFEPPAPNGPIAGVVDRFGHLPESTREWLEQLRNEDLDDWRQAMRSYRNFRIVWGFVRGLGVAVGGAFMAVVTISKAFPEAFAWIKGHF